MSHQKRLLLATFSSGNFSLSGFIKDGSDDTNSWLTSGTGLSSITFNYVKFNEDINLQCYKAIASAAALQTEWTSATYQGYYTFNQFTKFGRYFQCSNYTKLWLVWHYNTVC